MNAARELDVMRRETHALIARSEQQLRGSGQEPLGTATCTALLAHHNQWYVGKVSGALRDGGCVVLPYVLNGADAVGTAAAEQPDLILVEDALEMLSGQEVVRQIRALCPDTIIAAQVPYSDGIGAMTDAGAVAVFTRQVPPAEVGKALLSLIWR
jgi:CheY-like chemotaxis protein